MHTISREEYGPISHWHVLAPTHPGSMRIIATCTDEAVAFDKADVAKWLYGAGYALPCVCAAAADTCSQCGGPFTTPADSPLVLSPYCKPCAQAWSEREHAESDARYGAVMSGALATTPPS